MSDERVSGVDGKALVLRGVAFVGGIAVLLVVLWLGAFHWPEPVPSDSAAATAAENSSKRTATLAVVAGLIALGGLIVSVSNYRRQAKHDAHVHEKDRQDLVQQRYSTAIEHLGSTTPAVRAAAVYALEDVIQADSSRRVAIVQTLVALVSGTPSVDDVDDDDEEVAVDVPDVPSIAAQVVIARRKGSLGAPPAQLAAADLRAFALPGADLSSANLRDAILSGTNLRGANLGYAALRGANLHDADLRETNLRDANLNDTKLTAAKLCDANLSETDLGFADLSGADMARANLRSADLRGANLRGTNLRGADLTDAKFDRACSWAGAQVWGVKGKSEDWCPRGAVREPPAGDNEDETPRSP